MNNHRRKENLTFAEAKEAMAQLYESADLQKRYILRTHVLYGYNDLFGRGSICDLPSDEDQQYFIENCKELIKMPQTKETLRAELYREIKEFEKCIEYLESITTDDPKEQTIRNQIRENALNRVSWVFEVSVE